MESDDYTQAFLSGRFWLGFDRATDEADPPFGDMYDAANPYKGQCFFILLSPSRASTCVHDTSDMGVFRLLCRE